MKIFNILVGLSLVVLLASFVYQTRDLRNIHLAPVQGSVQSVTAIDLKAGFPDFTQVTTDQGQYLIGVLVEIPRQTRIVIRQERGPRFLCLAPTEEGQDPRTLQCWKVLSRSLQELRP